MLPPEIQDLRRRGALLAAALEFSPPSLYLAAAPAWLAEMQTVGDALDRFIVERDGPAALAIVHPGDYRVGGTGRDPHEVRRPPQRVHAPRNPGW